MMTNNALACTGVKLTQKCWTASCIIVFLQYYLDVRELLKDSQLPKFSYASPILVGIMASTSMSMTLNFLLLEEVSFRVSGSYR